MTAVTTTLFEGADSRLAMSALVDCAMQASSAAGAAFTAPDQSTQELRVTVAVGILTAWQGALLPADGTLAESVIAGGGPTLIADPTVDPRTSVAMSAVPQMGSTIAAPIVGNRRVHGVLTLTHCRGAESFGSADLEMITAFTTHAGLALDVAELRRDQETIRVLEDRQRIASDLQETLIRDLFGLGLSLQGVASRITSSDARAGLAASVDELDRIIRGVRTAVFAMEPLDKAQDDG